MSIFLKMWDKESQNPIANSAVATAIESVQDSLARIRFGRSSISGTFSGGGFTASVNYGFDLGTTNYVLLITPHRDGVNKTMFSVKKKRSNGFDLYVDTTSNFYREGFEINWMIVIV